MGELHEQGAFSGDECLRSMDGAGELAVGSCVSEVVGAAGGDDVALENGDAEGGGAIEGEIGEKDVLKPLRSPGRLELGHGVAVPGTRGGRQGHGNHSQAAVPAHDTLGCHRPGIPTCTR